MKIIAIANQKGGVGKTTTSVNLSAAIAELGKSVLLIDLDPQANATSGFGLEPEEGKSLYPVLLEEKTIQEQIIETHRKNLFIIPSEIDLAGCEIELARMDEPLAKLRETLEPLRQLAAYDYVFIDCPPSVGILMTNALAAADALLVPVQCEFYALEGISKILGLIEQIKQSGANPNLELFGVLMTMYDARTRLSQQVVDEVKEHLPNKVFKAVIPRTVRLSEAPSFGKTIFDYDNSGIGSTSYRNLAKEFIERS